MNIQVHAKVVYKNSYPPDLTGTRAYASIFASMTNTLSFAGSSPSMSLGSFNALTETPNFYATQVTVGSSLADSYVLATSWTTAYEVVYVDFAKAGPIPVFSFCADGADYSECRVYTGLVNIMVARFRSASTSLTLDRGSQTILYP